MTNMLVTGKTDDLANDEYSRLWKSLNIVILELFPIVLLVAVFAKRLAGMRVVFHTDNEALVHILNYHTSKDMKVMVLLRPLVLLFLKHNIVFRE